jgi:hypothetical protein
MSKARFTQENLEAQGGGFKSSSEMFHSGMCDDKNLQF